MYISLEQLILFIFTLIVASSVYKLYSDKFRDNDKKDGDANEESDKDA